MCLVPFSRTPLSTAYCMLVMNVGSFDRFTVAFHFKSTSFAQVAAPLTGEEKVSGAVCMSTPCAPGTPSCERVTELAASIIETCIPGWV